MNVSDIIDGIIKKKEELEMTNQALADASGVPKSTVDRILRKEAASPSIQNVLDIAAAVGYRFGGDIQKPDFPVDEKFTNYIMQLNEDRILRMRAHYNQLLAEKNRWIHYLFFLCMILIVFIMMMLVIDVLHPDIGWIREHLGLVRKIFPNV